jgi:hypothetical protein
MLCFLCCIYLSSLVSFSPSEKLPPCHKQENKQADSSCPLLLKSYFKTEYSDLSKTIFLIKRNFNFERQMLIFKAISNSYFELRYIHKQVYLLHNRLNL